MDAKKGSGRKIEKILIANRGEIAVRVIKTCRKLGISTVVVYTIPDKESLAVRLADLAVAVGETNAYLSAEKMIEAAIRTGCDAIHPGFGFLSENAEFSRSVEAAGLIFIGPSAHSISCMGSKIEAKRLLTQPEYVKVVPVIPGYNGVAQDDDTLVAEAIKIGYPVLLKASAGGGGKGMRVVWKHEDLLPSLASARRESLESFGDSKLLLEKYFTSVRHVEIQIFADNYNNCISLFERDCSIQRRHQKVIEETPSPVMTPELRERMGKVAVSIGKAINYRNAGTVEFILDDNNNFYFLEVNTRLQVEHPITEAITGLDLVELQIRVAEGVSLAQVGLADGPSRKSGHALEVRLYAEDPNNNFLPAPGRLIHFVPALIEGVRYDSGVDSGSEISMYYDPMIAKVIAYGDTRQHALQRMIQALKQTVIIGLTTNQHFLIQVLQNPDFVRGHFNTHFLENHPDITKETISPETYMTVSVAAMLFSWWINKESQLLHRHVTSGFRNLRSSNEYKTFIIDDQEIKVEYRALPQTFTQTQDLYKQSFHFQVQIAGNNLDVSFETNPKEFGLVRHPRTSHFSGFVFAIINGLRRPFFVYKVTEKEEIYVSSVSLPRQFIATLKPKLIVKTAETASSSLYKASMAGKIVSVLVSPGADAKEGDTLLIMESMKMETKIFSRHNGVIDQVYVEAGQVVNEGQPLVLFKEE